MYLGKADFPAKMTPSMKAFNFPQYSFRSLYNADSTIAAGIMTVIEVDNIF